METFKVYRDGQYDLKANLSFKAHILINAKREVITQTFIQAVSTIDNFFVNH